MLPLNLHRGLEVWRGLQLLMNYSQLSSVDAEVSCPHGNVAGMTSWYKVVNRSCPTIARRDDMGCAEVVAGDRRGATVALCSIRLFMIEIPASRFMGFLHNGFGFVAAITSLQYLEYQTFDIFPTRTNAIRDFIDVSNVMPQHQFFQL